MLEDELSKLELNQKQRVSELRKHTPLCDKSISSYKNNYFNIYQNKNVQIELSFIPSFNNTVFLYECKILLT